ncbi:hypothetical protein PAAG_01441 [Paracoccidioides lutzii Pb01]|uniref:Uncharacterized protein n=1 Tax=Paracoccidioides lutzii (strain ATCC MYA-826 / Pb01) TaxID=502779 RepID=C1GSE6_PARBA|nr:hypothetical protein PAAG_01441 [Paracoccidioides lutzii Pb01]EEH38979.1 hypothetical protein PAAG_01441 [Paracoccidioides lutzii Pb01]
MASTEAEPRSTIAINDDTDAETDAPRSPPRKLRRKRRLMDNSLQDYEVLFDGPAILNSSASTKSQPLKCEIHNLKAVLASSHQSWTCPLLILGKATAKQKIHTVFEAGSAKIRDLQEVQRLKKWDTELEIKHWEELIGKNKEICKLEAEVSELEHRCQCPICYTILQSGKPACADTGSAQGVSFLTQRPVDHVVEISLAI